MRSNSIAYRNFINRKRVAFVGPATNLVGKGMGALIDSYDICNSNEWGLSSGP